MPDGVGTMRECGRNAARIGRVKTITRPLTIIAALIVAMPAEAAQTIGYGSRAGMEVDVMSVSGLDTAHAVIHTKHSRENAVAFCRDYVQKVTPKCIKEELAVPLRATISADCTTGRFTDFSGSRYRFAGLSKATIVLAKYRLVDLATGQAEDGSMASAYSTNMRIYRALCPHRAPADE